MILPILLLIFSAVFAEGWKYHDERNWADLCREGTHQSPVALLRFNAQQIIDLISYPPLLFIGYGRERVITLKNNGHSVEARQKSSDSIPEVSGGGLSGVYQLDHLHFHWNSEHTIDYYRFPLELHLVHYSKKFGSLSESLKHPGGVTVFAVLFDLSPDDVQDYNPLIAKVASLQSRLNVPEELEGFIIKDYLPRDTAGYYRYDGSLTTPNCTEGVIWTVFTNTVPISTHQVAVFEKVQAEDRTILKENYRSLQPLYDRRPVLKISPIRSTAGRDSIPRITISTLVFLILINYISTINVIS